MSNSNIELFHQTLTILKDAYSEYYNTVCNEETVYYDAVRYELYQVVPIYAVGIL
jgi:hypothetical protein